MMNNIILNTDSYKVSHFLQYPPGTNRVYSYYESRGGEFKEAVFFGLSYLIQEHLAGQVVTQAKIEEAAEMFREHFGDESLFNRAGWEHILQAHDGRLPIRIKAVPEGMIVPVQNVLMTVENTDSECFWLTNYVETLLCQLWYPITVATQSREIKKTILDFLERTGTPEQIGFKLHDFGFRGSTSTESAAIGGAAHLINFMGTDTFAANVLLRRYYNEKMAGFSIPAAEHSTITSWGRENEIEAFRNMIDQFGHLPLYAVVSDSYDIFAACKDLWGDQLRDEVMSAKGTLVVRPDSGKLPQTVLKVLSKLEGRFGSSLNEKGFRVLNDKVRVIQGDGVNHDTIYTILNHMEHGGWSADNIAFGSGGALLQQMDRDTMKFAFKCAQARVNGVWREVYKDPVTDPGKKSKRGRLSLIKDQNGRLTTVSQHPEDILQVVFHNGKHLVRPNFTAIRERAKC